MKKEFEVVFTTNPTSEDIYGEILYDSQILCRLIKTEVEDEEVEIEFFFDQIVLERKAERRFPLKDFMTILHEVEDELIRWLKNINKITLTPDCAQNDRIAAPARSPCDRGTDLFSPLISRYPVLPSSTQRLIQPHQRQRHVGVAFHQRLLRGQQFLLHGQHVKKVGGTRFILL